MKDIKINKVVLFDTETTGIEVEDRIIQVGALVLDRNVIDNNPITINETCQADVLIKVEAMEIHNITPEMLEGKHQFNETQFKQFFDLNNNENNALVAHNINFDLRMIEKEGIVNRMQLIDTQRVAKHVFPGLKSYRLQYLRYFFELYKNEKEVAEEFNIELKAHDVLSDVVFMYNLMDKLEEHMSDEMNIPDGEILSKMIELTATPVLEEKFPFGKHKGKLISEVIKIDKQYIKWLYANGNDMSDDLKYSLEYWLSK